MDWRICNDKFHLSVSFRLFSLCQNFIIYPLQNKESDTFSTFICSGVSV